MDKSRATTEIFAVGLNLRVSKIQGIIVFEKIQFATKKKS